MIQTIGAIQTNQSLPIQYLSDAFFTGTRNPLTQEKLTELAEFAKTIPEPVLYGLYNDDSHYAQTLELMLNSTLETRHRGIFFKRKVLPLLGEKTNLLDIGTGNGQFTKWIGNEFENVTVIDSNKEEIKAFNTTRKILHKRIRLNKIYDSFLNVSLTQNHYDLALLSHVLYYVDTKKWFDAVDLAYHSLKVGGYLVVVLSGDGLEKSELIKHFGGENIDIDFLAGQCFWEFGKKNVEIFSTRELIITTSLLAMLHIAGFFLCDAHAMIEKKRIIPYIEQKYKKAKDVYSMTTQQKFIVIRKV